MVNFIVELVFGSMPDRRNTSGTVHNSNAIINEQEKEKEISRTGHKSPAMPLFFHNPLDLYLQWRDISHNNFPDLIGIDRRIVMDQNIPQPDNLAPWNPGVVLL
jgi:hypothetical protein